MDAAEIGRALVQIQAEFLDDPEMRLTRGDVERRCSVPPEACEAILALLVEAGVLRPLPDGSLIHSAAADPFASSASRARVVASRPFGGVTFSSFAFPVREASRGHGVSPSTVH